MSADANEPGGATPTVHLRVPVQAHDASVHVFISHASNDAAIAKQLCAGLEAAGLPCWIAPRDVRAGESYAAAIVQAINSCRMLVLVLSQSAVQSAHVLREVERASSKKRPVLSIRLDDAELPPDLEYFLSANQWLDASCGPLEQVIPVLIESVREHHSGKSTRVALDSSAIARVGSGPASAVPGKTSFRWRTGAVKIALMVAAIGLALILVSNFWLGQHRSRDRAAPGAAASTSALEGAGGPIAVLPFTDLSAKHNQSSFALGLADEVRDLLSSIPEIAVIGRTSSLDFQGKQPSAQAIGANLGARYYVEGSVLQTGNRMRVTARLIDVSTGLQRWSDSYDRSVGDVLKMQDDISGALVRALQVALGAEDRGHPATIKNAEAYREYLTGRQMYDRTSKEGWEQAAAHMERAIDLDPTFAPAFAALAAVRARQTEWNYLPFREGYEKARESANEALRLDPNNARAHAELANIHTLYDWDWVAADRELKQALRFAPHDGWTLFFSGRLAVALGHWNEAREFAAASVAADPLAPRLLVGNGLTFYRTDRAATGAADIRRAISISPTSQGTNFYLGKAELAQGHVQAALVAFQAESPDPGLGRDEGLVMAYELLGRKTEAAQALARLVVADANVWPFGIAQAFAFLGDADETFKWLDRAYAQHDEVVLISGDPVFKKVETDPRYKAFLRKLKLIE